MQDDAEQLADIYRKFSVEISALTEFAFNQTLLLCELYAASEIDRRQGGSSALASNIAAYIVEGQLKSLQARHPQAKVVDGMLKALADIRETNAEQRQERAKDNPPAKVVDLQARILNASKGDIGA